MFKYFVKSIFSVFLLLGSVFGPTFAINHLYFYGDGCPHCKNVKEYFDEENILEKFDVEKKEVRNNKTNSLILAEYLKNLNTKNHERGVPFMVIVGDNGNISYKSGEAAIVDYFKEHLKRGTHLKNQKISQEKENSISGNTLKKEEKKDKLSLIIALLTTSVADSINPCVFAVMLLLLSTILTKSKSRKKAVFAGIMFVLAIFLGYTFLGRLLLELLGTIGRENSQTGYWLQVGIGGLGILIGLANLKDYFFPDILPPMEVPLSRRPKMQKIVKGVLSPRGAFGIGIILTAFLLPCTAGPYVTFATYLSSYPDIMNSSRAYYLYLLVYNIIFVLPMLIIIAIIGMGYKSVEELGTMRKKYRTTIHLIVGLLMLGLGSYILYTVF